MATKAATGARLWTAAAATESGVDWLAELPRKRVALAKPAGWPQTKTSAIWQTKTAATAATTAMLTVLDRAIVDHFCRNRRETAKLPVSTLKSGGTFNHRTDMHKSAELKRQAQ